MVFKRQSTVLLEVFHTLSSSCLRPRSSHLEIFTLSLFAQHLASQLTHDHVISSFLHEVVLGSCGRFTSCSVLILLVTIRPVLCSLRLSVGLESALVVDIGSGMCWLVLLVLMHLALCGLLVLRVLQHGEVKTVDASSGIWSPFLLIITWRVSAQALAPRKLVSETGLHRIVSSCGHSTWCLR